MAPDRRAGFYRGKHYSAWADTVKQLKREKRLPEAEELLWHLVAATENDARANGWGVAPWYYEQLAILARQRSDFATEVSVLERYAAAPKAPGATPPKLAERLAGARARLAKNGGNATAPCPACGASASLSATGSTGRCHACDATFVHPRGGHR